MLSDGKYLGRGGGTGPPGPMCVYIQNVYINNVMYTVDCDIRNMKYKI